MKYKSSLSYSAMELYKKCPLAFKYNYIDREPVEENIYTKKGSEVHDMLENILKDCSSLSEFNKRINNYSSIEHQLELSNFKRIESLRQSKFTDLTNYFKNDIELKLKLEELNIVSKIDRVYPSWTGDGYILLDYKTGKKRDNDYYYHQLALYTYVYNSFFPDKKIKYWEINFLSVDDTKNYFIVAVNEDMVRSIVEEYRKLIHTIKNDEVFKAKTSPLCLWCDFLHICPHQKSMINKFGYLIEKHKLDLDTKIRKAIAYREKTKPDKSNFIYSKIVGVTFTDFDLKQLSKGTELKLVREPLNAFDVNAIKVMYDNKHVGYIKKQLAKDMAKAMDNGKVYKCFVSEVTGGALSKENLGVNIKIVW